MRKETASNCQSHVCTAPVLRGLSASSICGGSCMLFTRAVHSFLSFWLCWVFTAAHRLSPVAVHELLSVEASLVAEHMLYAMCASVAVVCRLRCSVASGIFPDQGWNLGLLQWQADSQPLDTREVPCHLLIIYRASAGAQTPGWVQIGPSAVYTISTSSRNPCVCTQAEPISPFSELPTSLQAIL